MYLCQLIETMYFELESINRFSSSILFSCVHDNTLRGITNHGVRKFWILHLLNSLELLGIFAYFLGFFGNWNVTNFSNVILKILPISMVWTYFFF